MTTPAREPAPGMPARAVEDGLRPEARCPRCRHPLTAGAARCPECGAPTDPASLAAAAARAKRRRRWSLALTVIPLCAYAPYAWLLFIDYPWNEYRWSWIVRWPLLPGLLPASLLGSLASGGRLSAPSEMVVAAILAALMVALAIILGARGRWWLAGAAAVTLAMSAAASYGLYHLFHV